MESALTPNPWKTRWRREFSEGDKTWEFLNKREVKDEIESEKKKEAEEKLTLL